MYSGKEISNEEWTFHGIKTPSLAEMTMGLQTPARLLDIIDGDTIICVVPTLGHFLKFHIRLNGIDTCEIKSKDPEIKEKAMEARQYLIDALCGDKRDHQFDPSAAHSQQRKDLQHHLEDNCVLVYLHCNQFDKYGRLLADVFRISDTAKQRSLSTELIDCHLAYAYNGGKKEN